jgi:16S rRNA (cytidine1402-2'-O)-methyltransferase
MTLLLLPNLLFPHPKHSLFLPASVDDAMASLDGLIAESEKEGRRYLSRFKTKKKASDIPIALLNEKMGTKEVDFLLEPILKGEKWGIVADAGLPCLADPGARLVFRARKKKIPIICFAGPSSITHALMLSGLSAQRFYFHGYLSRYPEERKKELQRLEKLKEITHLFIEAPYRNAMLFKSCVQVLQDKTWLTLACELTSPDEWVATQRIEEWREQMEEIAHKIAKRPTLFLLRSH